jgi:hypothetical protein
MTHIEISPAPALYAVEFEFDWQLGVSIILPATCVLAAKLKAWRLFPEHRRNASRTTVHNVEYAEIDWQTGRTIVVKQQKRSTITAPLSSEPEQDFFNDWSIEEGGAS